VLLFLVIFIWTPPHFWALAVRYRDDYQAAHVPMLPVVASLRRTTLEILIYSVVMWALTLLIGPARTWMDLRRVGDRARRYVYVLRAASVSTRSSGQGQCRRSDATVPLFHHVPFGPLHLDGG